MLLSLRSSFDVITVGAAVQDTYVRSKALEEIRDPHAPDGLDVRMPFGAKIEVQDYHVLSGGGATNAAVTFARMGLKTGCICRMGQDRIGTALVDELKQEHIATTFVQYDANHNTGASVILLSGTGHRVILTHRGASAHIATHVLPWSRMHTQWLYIASVADNLPLLKELFAHAAKQHLRVAWNPGGGELTEGLRKLTPFLKQTDVLILNREEASLLSELPQRHLKQMFKKLSRYPRYATLITDGQKGAYAQFESTIFYTPAIASERVNTTGAGDAFGSGFISGLIHQLDIEDALRLAALNAAGVVSHMGPKTGILKRLPSAKERSRVHITTPTLNA